MKTLPDFTTVRSVLVVKPSSLGDIVHTLPAVHRLKQTFPQLKIDWLVNSEWAPLLEGNSDLNEIVIFPRRSFKGRGGWGRYRQWMQQFKWRVPPDVTLDFQGLFRSGWISKNSGAAMVAGMSDSREGARFFHHVRVRVDPIEHAVDRYLKLAAACGANSGNVEFPLPVGNCPEILRKAPVPRDFVLLHPFSRGEKKSLTTAQVIQFCQQMAPIGVFLVGMASQEESMLQLPPSTVNLLNKTSLSELLWLMRRARFTVSVDSGPMHMAAGLSANVLGIHTWSDPRLVGPYPEDAWIWKGGVIVKKSQADAMLASQTRQVNDADITAIVHFVLKRLESIG